MASDPSWAALSYGRLTAYAIGSWYENLTAVRDLSPGTAVRHFNVMHHMMEKASTIWSRETGIDRNPADQVEVRRPDDQRDRYLSEDELRRLKRALDEKMYRKGTRVINKMASGGRTCCTAKGCWPSGES